MAILKCKMCGGTLNITEGMTVCECEYCGTQQTITTSQDENMQALFNRANILRMKSEFDKAEQLYEKLVQNNPEDAEAHWGLILCKFGIEYVEDPATFKRIPTCHRTSFDSIIADEDYKEAIRCADTIQRGVYEREAKEIDRIQKEILALSAKEEPYDVFICYKESDNGSRTPDSVIANDIYHQLTNEGFKVFYAAITLEDKLGSAYEPCIFAALNSAKVMLAIGTKPEYFTAVWVRNEWSRFLRMMKTDRSKLLIPCYKDMDAYELPEEFAHLQAQDMSKIGFINDIVRGIKKVIVKDEPKPAAKAAPAAPSGNPTVNSLLKRAFIFLEDSDWASADEYCEKVLDLDPENGMAYLGKLMAELKVKKRESIKNCAQPFDSSNNYQKVLRYGNDALKAEMENCTQYIKDRNHKAYQESVYQKALAVYQNMSSTKEQVREAKKQFESVSGYKDADEYIRGFEDRIKEVDYQYALLLFASKNHSRNELRKAIKLLESTGGYKDSAEQIVKCRKRINYLDNLDTYDSANYILDSAKMEYKIGTSNNDSEFVKEAIQKLSEAKDLFTQIIGTEDSADKTQECERLSEEYDKEIIRINAEKQAAEIAAKKAKKKKKIIAAVIAAVVALGIGVTVLTVTVIIPESKYNSAVELMNSGKYDEAITAFEAMDGYKDSAEQITKCETGIKENKYNAAVELYTEGKYDEAYNAFFELDGYKDSSDKLAEMIAEPASISAKNSAFISAGHDHTVGLKKDGTVVAVGDNYYGQCNVSGWRDIIAVSAGDDHTVGLKKDGTVVAVGSNDDGRCDVSGWRDIIAVSAGDDYTVGLKKDGTVVAVGREDYGQCDVSGWSDIIAVSAGGIHTVGLKKDGTVVAVGDNDYGQCDVSGWKDIIAVSAGYSHTVGLKKDGTVVAVGENDYGQCDVSGWSDIIAVSAEFSHTVGLKRDGTVVAAGSGDECDVSGWRDIIAVSAGQYHTVGLKKDGTVVAVGGNGEGQCDVSGWELKTVEK